MLIGAVVLAACEGGGSGGHVSPTGPRPTATTPAPTDPSATLAQSGPPGPASPTVPADVPSTGPNLRSPGEQPPVMPLEATQHTPAGALAFAKFFIQTIDWGFATTSGAYMRHYYAPSCVECRSHADGLDNTRTAGERYLGSRFTLTGARSTGVGKQSADASALLAFDISSAAVLDSSNHPVSSDIARSGVQRQVWLAWKATHWTVVDMRPLR